MEKFTALKDYGVRIMTLSFIFQMRLKFLGKFVNQQLISLHGGSLKSMLTVPFKGDLLNLIFFYFII